MYYLTYRPKTIEEIDNVAPREIIKKILEGKSLPHAFLFVGQKGTGKTSTARIFAKSVNCLSNSFSKSHHTQKSVEPCNSCAHCKSIDKSSFPDVVEMDAASNRGINEIKSLIKESSFLPIAGSYRIFIIDEAHMITSDGFNALLKTLEEPSPTVIFILATTNMEKVPKTVLSRCIPVVFGKAKKDELVHMLQRICREEKLNISKEILEIIAQHSEGSFRDAAKLLEELVILNRLKEDEIKSYLGIRSKENLLGILHAKPISEALVWIDEFIHTGGSTKNLIEELLSQLHLMLLEKHKVGVKMPFSFSLQEIMLLMKVLSEAYNSLRHSPLESIPLEMAVVEFYSKRSEK
ncbi:DNA polymerase III, subunit gamma and tau [Candidatus Roizmanbacteria bacterium RIFOXYB2_FULL_38_10]|uniref:DNA polymerase III subunit gamma/tau n=1 Tax=Candidatus Roizmanbacteria bacterium RIFOXYD1_FULL_38_12 TaxID=1802093 RepID=A0A1F7L0P7_9BACT|nr:MAG: DNA polymerase III, subunit gamma and tau [Candidatus Roizmanbacteria bacterium RIFOXYA2_FULL_38_14]OGK63699.1 MAG: DNA polymerase III, subunit gamma and tau [Candidatus Roizmanbacteria bacterium RIFOXYA1_FULL_37_12]OGK65545.1 MAG: DNA polymerase III, subunit gamma and tau [Candidatus Roizmanbacteria bacterium RIFOXYB1_FULL_40_23]OGK68329.1 MAG: DNA polymerase III, subunit gamma and tau [Candidatus Roizmanbacteria bacterium RIFOXYB2_FULL_38_10]OGK69950.1 MAG: DNA polymerase III, subunit